MNFIVYDLECTCWSNELHEQVHETIEIGALKVDHYGQVIDEFTSFIRPVIHPVLSDFCLQLTHISQIDINRARKFDDVIKDFTRWIEIDNAKEEYALCSWGGFDKRQLVADCKLHQLDATWVESHINIKEQYKQLRKLRQPIGLKKAVEREGFEFTGVAHRAFTDAENLAKIVAKYLDLWWL